MKEIAKGKATKSISERINHHVTTEIGYSEKKNVRRMPRSQTAKYSENHTQSYPWENGFD